MALPHVVWILLFHTRGPGKWMKDHTKIFQEIQEQAHRDSEENRIRLEKEELKKEKQEEKDKEKGKQKEKEKNTLNSLSKTVMSTSTTPTPQDFYNLQGQFTKMQKMLAQLHTPNQ